MTPDEPQVAGGVVCAAFAGQGPAVIGERGGVRVRRLPIQLMTGGPRSRTSSLTLLRRISTLQLPLVMALRPGSADRLLRRRLPMARLTTASIRRCAVTAAPAEAGAASRGRGCATYTTRGDSLGGGRPRRPQRPRRAAHRRCRRRCARASCGSATARPVGRGPCPARTCSQAGAATTEKPSRAEPTVVPGA